MTTSSGDESSFRYADNPVRKRRSLKRLPLVIVMAFVMLLGAAMPVLADEPGDGKGKGKMGGMPFQWKATSPAIQEGDRYDLVVTNTGDEAQEAWIRTIIMDHRNHTNTDVVDELHPLVHHVGVGVVAMVHNNRADPGLLGLVADRKSVV